jgi:prolyl 4-hydroxylase
MLFYGQDPYGILDPKSEHGGCPVYKGVKWAANLWIWNKNRHADAGDGDYDERNDNTAVQIELVNTLEVPLEIRWGNSKAHARSTPRFNHWGEIPARERAGIGTFHGHHWRALIGDRVVFEHQVDAGEDEGPERAGTEQKPQIINIEDTWRNEEDL